MLYPTRKLSLAHFMVNGNVVVGNAATASQTA